MMFPTTKFRASNFSVYDWGLLCIYIYILLIYDIYYLYMIVLYIYILYIYVLYICVLYIYMFYIYMYYIMYYIYVYYIYTSTPCPPFTHNLLVPSGLPVAAWKRSYDTSWTAAFQIFQDGISEPLECNR